MSAPRLQDLAFPRLLWTSPLLRAAPSHGSTTPLPFGAWPVRRQSRRGKCGGISLLPGDQADLSKLTTGEADQLRAVGLDPDRARQLGGEAAARSALRKLTPRRQPSPARRRGSGQGPADGGRLRIGYRRSGAASGQGLVADPYGLVQRAGRPRMFASEAARGLVRRLAAGIVGMHSARGDTGAMWRE